MGSHVDALVVSNHIVAFNQIFKGAVAIKDGKIVRVIHGRGRMPSSDRIVDCGDAFVLPGLIDSHVHLRDPGFPAKEDFESGTKAAANGGFTTIMDMPNTVPFVDSPEAFVTKLRSIEKKSLIDFCLQGCATSRNLSTLGSLKDFAPSSFEVFMGDVAENFAISNLKDLSLILDWGANTGAVIGISPLAKDLIDENAGKARDPETHAKQRPNRSEAAAVASVVTLTSGKGKTVLRQLSTRESIIIIEALSSRRSYCETTPHYLLLDMRMAGKLGPFGIVNPPLRSREDRISMWQALLIGRIDIIASDHAPHTLDDKTNTDGVAPGFPGLETTVPMLFTLVKNGRVDIRRLVQVMSENPAKTYGLFPRKGVIAPGADADLTVVDLKRRFRIRGEDFYSKAKWTPFEGKLCMAKPEFTIVRGEVIMDHGLIVSRPGYGRFQSAS